MPWIRPEDAEFGRGILTEIPDRGYVGWACNYSLPDPLADPVPEVGTYTCRSRFISLADFHLDYVNDLSAETDGDNLYQPYRVEGNWTCHMTVNLEEKDE